MKRNPKPVILPAPTEETMPFLNCEGRIVHFNGKARIEDLVREGIKFSIVPIEEPLPKDPSYYTHAP